MRAGAADRGPTNQLILVGARVLAGHEDLEALRDLFAVELAPYLEHGQRENRDKAPL